MEMSGLLFLFFVGTRVGYKSQVLSAPNLLAVSHLRLLSLVKMFKLIFSDLQPGTVQPHTGRQLTVNVSGTEAGRLRLTLLVEFRIVKWTLIF